MNQAHRWGAAAAFALLLAGMAGGCSSGHSGEGPNIVYICSETKQLTVGPQQPTPALNPKTGRKTLYRALYCSQCRQWHAVPPEGAASGNPLAYPCPKHNIAMSAEGPLE